MNQQIKLPTVVEMITREEDSHDDKSPLSVKKSQSDVPVETQPDKPQDGKLASLYFISIGIAALIPWSTILSTLDYYQAQFPTRQVTFNFPAAFSATILLTKLLMVWFKEVMSLNTRIAKFLGLQTILLCCLPAISGLLSNSDSGYWIVIFTLVILGTVSQISYASATGLFGYFPPKYVSNFTTGTGLGGIMSNILRAITLICFRGTNEKSYLFGMCVQYGVTAGFLVFCIILHYKFVNSRYAADQINRHANEGCAPDEFKSSVETSHMTNIKTGLLKLWVTFRRAPTLSLFMILIYIQTLMLFPGVTLKQDIPNIDISWKIILIMVTYNVFDTFGKYLSIKRSLFNKGFIYKLILCRFVFYFTFIAQVTSTDAPILDEVWFTLVNLALFGLTNGFTTSALFIFGPEEFEGEDKEIVGFLLLNCLSLGIMLGSFLALPLSNL